MIEEGKQELALEVGDKYFQSFPNMNFPFAYQTLQMVQPWMMAREGSRIRPVLEQLARNATDRLDFYNSLEQNVVASSYAKDLQLNELIVSNLLRQTQQQNDPELAASIRQILGNYLYLAPEDQPQAPTQQ